MKSKRDPEQKKNEHIKKDLNDVIDTLKIWVLENPYTPTDLSVIYNPSKWSDLWNHFLRIVKGLDSYHQKSIVRLKPKVRLHRSYCSGTLI